MLGKTLKFQALVIALVAVSCVIEDGAQAIAKKITRCVVRDFTLATVSHIAAGAASSTKKALAKVMLLMHAFSLFDVYVRGSSCCPTKLMAAQACAGALAYGLYGGALPIPKIGGGKKKSAKKSASSAKKATPKRASSRSSSRSRK
jgi:hypothetical protein